MRQFTGFVYCPKCGQPKLISQDAKSVRCQACNFVYYHNSASAVAAIIETPRGILFNRRRLEPGAGLLDLPGGFVDYNESNETALEREVKEELGLQIAGLRYLGSFPNRYDYRGVTYFTVDSVFICSVVNLKEARMSSEVSEIIEVDPHDLDLGQIAFGSMRRGVEEYLDRKKRK